MKRNILMISAFLCLYFCGFAQSNPNIQEVKIGQEIPDQTLKNSFGKDDLPEKISSLKGKVILLDFWATWCSPCVAAFSKNEILQREFGDQIQFINVGYESRQIITKILPSIYGNKKTEFIWLSDDRDFIKMFPHTFLPHYVWIDKNGIYRAATEGTFLTEENIKNAISGDFSKLKQKTDKGMDSVNMQAKRGKILFSSTLSSYIAGGEMIARFPRPDSLEGLKAEVLGYGIKGIYQHAYHNEDFFNKKNTQVDVKDPSRFTSSLVGQDYINWLVDGHGYNWRVQVPSDGNLFSYMQEQLKFIFPQYQANVELRDKESWVLIRTSKNDKIATKGGKQSNSFSQRGIELVNVPIRALINPLKVKFMSKSELFIVDQTGYSGSVDMSLSGDMSNMEEINRALVAYDLQFIKKNAPNKILFIREKEGPKRNINPNTLK